MRVVYIGSIEFSWHCLDKILKNKLAEVVGIYNVHPRYSENISDYRDQKELAEKYRVSHHWFRNINDKETIESISKLKPDLVIVFGLSQLIKPPLLQIPKLGVLGSHPTLLPKNRGRAPIPWSILKGLKKSGLTFMLLNEGADTGDIVYQKEWNIAGTDDAGRLYKKMIVTGIKMIEVTLPKFAQGSIHPKKQPLKSNYWPARSIEDGRINWRSRLPTIERLIRATTWPYPGAYCFMKGKKLIIWNARTKSVNKKATLGQVLAKSRARIEIKCKSGILLATKWEPSDIEIKQGDIFS